jgi:hypothetical protein
MREPVERKLDRQLDAKLSLAHARWKAFLRTVPFPLTLSTSIPLLLMLPVVGFAVTPERCSHWGFNYFTVPAVWGLAALCVPCLHYFSCCLAFSLKRGADLRFKDKLLLAACLAVAYCVVAAVLGVAFILGSNPHNSTGYE